MGRSAWTPGIAQERGIRTIKCAVLLVERSVVAEAGPEADILR
jgi:hypothetical protein